MPDERLINLRSHLDQRLAALRSDRDSWWVHWQELAQFILPRRYKWLITPNQASRGSQINTAIIDSTGTIAARTLASGMMSGNTSPTRPWFKLKIQGYANDESHPVSIWLADVERLMLRIFQESNFYTSMATLYADIAVFGTAAMLIYEDFEDVIRCYNPCAGEYFLANSARMDVGLFYRQFTLTTDQISKMFPKENWPQDVKNAKETNGALLQNERVVNHAIEPNDDSLSSIPRRFPFREVYWIHGSGSTEILKEQGFFEAPFMCPRWDLVANDPYGRGTGMDALPDIKQLQQETKRKAQALDKLVNPPMVADIELKNQPASLLPGGVTYVTKKDGAGFKPVYQVAPPVREIMQDIQEIQNRIRTIFFNDLFMMFQQLEAEPRSAAAVDARREEKMIMLGPVLERLQNEAFDPAIDRTFNIALRRKILPPPPQEIQGQPIEVSYVSMLAEAQRAVSSTGVERLVGFAGNLVAVQPEVMDNIDLDEAISEYGSFMGVSPKLIRARDEVAALRQARAKQQQQIQQLQMTDAAVKGAKTLSETDVGGGSNALQAMLGNQ